MNGLPYYKAYPRDFIEGTVGMPFELKAAYRLVLDLIYMQNGELPDDDRYISGLLSMSIRKWRKIRLELLASGKIVKSGDILTNARADREIAETNKMRDKNAENGRQSNKSKDLAKAIVKPKESKISIEREAGGGERGSRISKDFDLSPERVEMAKKTGVDQSQISKEFDQFVDYWLGVAGQKGIKKDWNATWRVWCRNSLNRSGFGVSRQSSRSSGPNLYSGI